MSQAIKELIIKNVSHNQIEEQAKKEGMLTMLEDGIYKASQGITTIGKSSRGLRIIFNGKITHIKLGEMMALWWRRLKSPPTGLLWRAKCAPRAALISAVPLLEKENKWSPLALINQVKLKDKILLLTV